MNIERLTDTHTQQINGVTSSQNILRKDLYKTKDINTKILINDEDLLNRVFDKTIKKLYLKMLVS
ncbi:hypothetical protein [Vallitalea okinawensis]|uniref:hypothetical protein n=1 Tax=Vallitalea okinawensis TaxID=2078660 RepID=UPI000CFBA90F|nr:hypothetical protein [Vallitalea okinawensis]